MIKEKSTYNKVCGCEVYNGSLQMSNKDLSFWTWKTIFLCYVAGAISLRNNDDDNTINKGRYAVKQKTPSEREASLNN